MGMFSGVVQTLDDSLQYASAKNRAISNNIANADTPGYKAKNVDFKNVLQQEMTSPQAAKRTRPEHIPFSQANTNQSFSTTTDNTAYNHNGNSVDVDKEMADLAKNQIYYQALVDRLNGKLSSLKTAIGGGS